MRILVVGTGGVGSAFAGVAQRRSFFEHCALADYDPARSQAVVASLDDERGLYTTAPFSEPEVFDFPEGIGPVERVNVEHEEVLLVPRWIDCRRVAAALPDPATLGDDRLRAVLAHRPRVVGQTAINPVVALELLASGDWAGAGVLGPEATLHKLGLDSTEKISVNGVEVAPRDVDDVVEVGLPRLAVLPETRDERAGAGLPVTPLTASSSSPPMRKRRSDSLLLGVSRAPVDLGRAGSSTRRHATF